MIGRRGGVRYPLLTNLVAYWSLDETSVGIVPVTRADSAGTSTLTDNNTTASAAGKVSNGADFEATNTEWLSSADNASLSTGDIDFTVAAWVKAETLAGSARRIVTKMTDTSVREYSLHYNAATARFTFYVANAAGALVGTVSADTLGAPSTGTWYFIVAWHDSVNNTVSIQVNNGAADSANTTGVPADTAATFQIGAYGAGLEPFDGIIDEVGFWKRTLTTAERTWLFNSGNGRSYAAIVAVNG